jgi:replicative DNA helicase
LVTVLADTGTGKTAILQNMANKARPLKTIIFEMELPEPLMFERSIAINTGFPCKDVELGYRNGDVLGSDDLRRLDDMLICTEPKMTTERLEMLINRSELKFGCRPQIVFVDYIGLIQGKGRSRYERLSDTAEELKIIAKATNTILVLASQIHRKGAEDDAEIFLHDAKDSGSIENSSGLVLGAWRSGDGSTMCIKVLKNTKGRSGDIIECNFNGASLRITERSRIE